MLALYIKYNAYSGMSPESEQKERFDEQREESPYKCSIYVIVRFLTEQNLSNTRTACTEISNRFKLI